MSADASSNAGIQPLLLGAIADLRSDLRDVREDVQGLRTDLSVHLELHKANTAAEQARADQKRSQATDRREGLRSRLMLVSAFSWLFGAISNVALAHWMAGR